MEKEIKETKTRKKPVKLTTKEEKKVVRKSASTAAKKTTAPKKAVAKKSESKTTTKTEKKVDPKKETIKKATTTPTAKKTSTKTEKKAPVKKEVVKKTTTKASKTVSKKEENINTNTREIDLTELREIIKEEKATAVRIPDVRGMSVEAAKDRLLALDIEYNDDIEKEYSLRIKAGRVTRTKPEANSLYDKTKKVTIYESRNKLLLLFIMLALLAAGIFGLTYGKDILDSINEQILHVGDKSPIDVDLGEFTDEKGKPIWTNTNIIKINKTNSKIGKYKYCISKDKSKEGCVWKETTVPNIVIEESGHLYITIIPVGDKEYPEKNVEIYIDTNAPKVDKLEVLEISANTIKVKTTALDRDSGIAGYYYSLNGMDYTEDGDTHIFKDLKPDTEYTIYVMIIDKAGNKTVVKVKARTLKENGKVDTIEIEDEWVMLNLYYPEGSTNHEWQVTSRKDGWHPYEGPIKVKFLELNDVHIRYELNGELITVDKDGNIVKKEKLDEPSVPDGNDNISEEVKEWDIPQINLDLVPNSFEYGESYELPSFVDFGNDTGEVICLAEGKVYTNTNQLRAGKHTIECSAISSHEKSVTVSKEIRVEVKKGNDEVFDGWMLLNLYYPEGSYNWQWRLDGVNGIRTGYNGDDWQDYTGPILVKLEDIENIYIRYDMDGETYIVAPKGKVSVDIEPNNWTLRDGETTKVKINYEKGTVNQQYRINGGDWQDYEGTFEVGPNTLVEAKCIKNEKVYDSNGDYQYTSTKTGNDTAYISMYVDPASPAPSGPGGVTVVVKPPTPGTPTDPTEPTITQPGPGAQAPEKLAGPTIISSPNQELAQGTTVFIRTAEEAEKIYYKEDNGSYKEYTGQFEVFKNERIAAYYVRKSDGKVSATTYYRVDNIYVEGYPYVKISADPDNYLTDTINSVQVTITGNNYDTLEYSLDGVIYKPYTNPLTITESVTVYAKGKNSTGETIETLSIKTPKKAAIPYDNIDINISANPTKEDVVGLVNKTTITITYDSNAVNKYYSINGGTYQEYTGPFDITENATITAYATGNYAVGQEELVVDYLTTGIANPKITVNTTQKAYQVLVTIDYPKTASIKQYKLGTGSYKTYTGPFYVTENTIVYARGEDTLGNVGTSSRIISNVISGPDYLVLDKGDYYLIRLNYPDVSDPAAREYKWKPNGTWKTYDSKGIVLVKAEKKEEYLNNNTTQVEVEDASGNTVYVDKEHVYLLDCSISEVMENLFMRWDNEKPQAPTIVVMPNDTPVKEVEVKINYPSTLINKYYKLVKADGTDTGWLDYTGTFKVSDSDTVVYAKGTNRIEVESKVATKKITNIDEEAPEIEVKGDLETPKYNVVLTVKATDNIMMQEVKYAKGSHDESYFEENGTNIANNSQITIEENGTYTMYAIDQAGNKTVKEVEIGNVDKTKPNITINVLTQGIKSQVEVAIDYGDSVTKEYSVDGITYQPYPASGNLMLSAYDLFDMKNPDGTLTLYAKGTKSTGVSDVVSEKIYNLDLDKIKAPVISASQGYPILTEYGIVYDDNLTVTYDDTRDDLINEISLDGGNTWKVYTGLEHVQSGTVKARSTNPVTGLMVESSKTVTAPSDSVGREACDGNTSTYYALSWYASGAKEKFIYVDDSMLIKEFKVDFRESLGVKLIAKYYNASGNLISTQEYTGGNRQTQVFTIPSGTTKIGFYNSPTGNGGVDIYEIIVNNAPKITNEKVLPLITEYGVEQPYSDVTIGYFNTSVQKLYKIDNGDWKKYNGNIKLKLGETVYAKGVDLYGVDTPISQYTSVINPDAVETSAYDKNSSTKYALSWYASGVKEKYMAVDSTMVGKKISVDMNLPLYVELTAKYYNASGSLISSQSYKSNNRQTQVFTIPAGTAKVGFYNSPTGNGGVDLYEITMFNTPVISYTQSYPVIAEYGVDQGFSNVTISYFNTSVQKLYKINSGEWKEYTGKIKLGLNQTVYAKGIDKNGIETPTSQYTATLLDDAVGAAAYDGNTGTSYQLTKYASGAKERFMSVDSGLQGKQIKVDFRMSLYVELTAKYYNASGSLISSQTYKSGNRQTQVFTIPANTVKVGFYNSPTGNGGVDIFEIYPADRKIVTSTYTYPKLTVNGFENGYYTATLHKQGTSQSTSYSLDNGSTWTLYSEPFRVENGTTLLAKEKLSSGSDSGVQTYNFVAKSDELSSAVSTIPASNSRIFTVDSTLVGDKLRIYSNSEPASNANIKVYDKNNNLVDTYTFNGKVAVIDVKNNSYKVVISSGSESLNIIDINLRDSNINVDGNTPIIATNTSNWSLTKMVSIIYPSGYTNEYSIDRGTTWNTYTDSFEVDDESIIFARSVDNNGKVVSSSSYKVTKIDTTVPTVELNISDKIVLGDSNNLPSSYTVDNTKSGGSASCKVGDDPITNTSSLTAGEYTIVCTVTTGVGKTASTNKTIKVLDKYEITFDYQVEGINNTQKLVVEESSLGTLPTTTRDNYVLDGWYTSEDVAITENTIPAGDTTYYAKWKEKTARDEIVTSNTINSSNINLTSTATSSDSGLYKVSVSGKGYGGSTTGGDTYIFRGDTDKNIVEFAGFTWRIVRINEDGTIRLILDDKISDTGTLFYSKTSDYTKAYYSNSDVKPVVEEWYQENIVDTGYSDKVATGNYFCESSKVRAYNNVTMGNVNPVYYEDYTPDLLCNTDANGMGLLNNSVGLITYDELVYAGVVPNVENLNSYFYNGVGHTNDYFWWTMSPNGLLTNTVRLWGVQRANDFLTMSTHQSDSYIRPVINLSKDVKLVKNSEGHYVVQ